MIFRTLTGAILALSFSAAAPASAAGLTTLLDDINADANFVAACGGSDTFGCEYTVAQGVAGNRQTNGNTEVAIFNRLTNTAKGGQTNGFVDPSSFSLSYDADGGSGGLGRLIFSAVNSSALFDDYDFGAAPGGNNPSGVAQSLAIRAARASLSNLLLNGMGLPDVDALSTETVKYLYVGGFDLTADWMLTGTVDMSENFKNSGTGFQVKVTDLAVPSQVPLPAGLPLLAAGLGLLGLHRKWRRAA